MRIAGEVRWTEHGAYVSHTIKFIWRDGREVWIDAEDMKKFNAMSDAEKNQITEQGFKKWRESRRTNAQPEASA